MRVYVAIWEHPDAKSTIRTFAREEDARKWYRQIPQDCWADQMKGKEKPEDREVAAEAYWDAMCERDSSPELFLLHETEVEGLADAS